ncbi:MAG TPA: MBL fold metallo-hydrolase [Candidatus Acidoferrum sp.]|jgi:L-ascorbate metabolism protein UlaG (beta-lactamase superfamily)|nr:MBL fold metallo-hydrolase [Candidatus Acidoferrum sp.]
MLSRGDFLQTSAAAAVGTAAAGEVAQAATPGKSVKVRWFGGGVYELATPDDSAIVLVDAWIWNNAGWKAFNLDKPPELQSASAFAAHVKSRNPQYVLVALTHDHGDHMGDYFELLPALVAAGVPVMTVGQSDLFRVALVPKFKAANLDPAKIVLNGGAGMNFGGSATFGTIHTRLVPAVHSTFAGFPAAGFIIDLGGVRVYASGDTDLFSDMAEFGRRYQPQLAVLSAGNGPYTMNPEDAAQAVKLLNVPHAIPVHYAHNAQVLGPQAGDTFKAAVARVAPQTAVTVMHPGESVTIS